MLTNHTKHRYRIRFHYVTHDGGVGKTIHEMEVDARSSDIAIGMVAEARGEIWIRNVEGPLLSLTSAE